MSLGSASSLARPGALLISMNVPCGTHWVQTGNRWWKGHWEVSCCGQVDTIAGVSFALDLGVGCSITCCGATAWGTASATTCGSIVGITKCAGCTATVAAVSGLTKVANGSQCDYGLGVVATVTCKVGNYTVLAATWPFGWAIPGPCAPAGWPCP